MKILNKFSRLAVAGAFFSLSLLTKGYALEASATHLPSDAAYQVIANIAYSNPAALNSVKK